MEDMVRGERKRMMWTEETMRVKRGRTSYFCSQNHHLRGEVVSYTNMLRWDFSFMVLCVLLYTKVDFAFLKLIIEAALKLLNKLNRLHIYTFTSLQLLYP